MGQALAKLYLLAMMVGGCSVLYDPKGLPAAADAPVFPKDSNPRNLVLTDVGPPVVYEGQGEGGSRPALVVIRGSDISPDATIEILPPSGQSTMFTVGSPSVASDFSVIAVSMMIPVDPMLATDVPLDIKVIQPAGDGGNIEATLTGKLKLRGLPELTNVILDAGQADTSQLAELYSKITLPMPVIWKGSKRVQLRATSSITVDNLTANGGSASGATPGGGGPGGCAGGPSASMGLCPGGGSPGASTTLTAGGGGGGGYYRVGTPGGGTGGGAGGQRIGDPLIATYEGFGTFTPNKASGGAGGGGSVLGTGGRGGGGGGTIELTAEGDVTVKAIVARGGNGGNKTGLTPGGGGGGGAGGTVMLRAGGALTVASVDVTGGGGGGAGDVLGGPGSPGRVRWDALDKNQLMNVQPAESEPHRGPSFTPLVNAAVRNPMLPVTLVGTTNDMFQIFVVDHQGIQKLGDLGTFSDGVSTFEVPLTPGYNRVCVTMQGGQRGTSEADKCIEAAYLP